MTFASMRRVCLVNALSFLFAFEVSSDTSPSGVMRITSVFCRQFHHFAYYRLQGCIYALCGASHHTLSAEFCAVLVTIRVTTNGELQMPCGNHNHGIPSCISD